MVKLSLKQYEMLSLSRCPRDNALLSEVKRYPHSEGYPVEGFTEKQWLYKTCSKCRYDWALWKIEKVRT